ncbi:MAG TPA: hypothetical protein EYG00_10960 [Alcanivorax sp.]|nr:hypothetical protein [Alcanivorax sp.]HIK75200.1 hypothetical protein [Alcanivorax sp.]
MRMELVDLALRSHSLSMDKDFFPALVTDWDLFTLESMATITFSKLIPKPGENSFARFVQSLGLRWIFREGGEDKVVATIEASYGLLFSTEAELHSPHLDEEISGQVISAAWPYWRQDFSQTATKASLPLVAMPPAPDFSFKK